MIEEVSNMKVVIIAACATCGKAGKVSHLLECGTGRAYVCKECLSRNWLVESPSKD